ncbi:hypothetical protein [Nocardioides sp. YIM 152588]|uniref:hypothetical protein n=1 Tax=Nocardioides sp. YIM 152588 TaxID=3158259 RepID=UPI0032E50E07
MSREHRGSLRRALAVLTAALMLGAAVPAAASAAAAADPSTPPDPADPAVSFTCARSGSLYKCVLPSSTSVSVPVTLAQVVAAVKAAGGDVTASDPAMWIAGRGGSGSNGTRCGGCDYNGGSGGSGGYARVTVSPASYADRYGVETLYYAVGRVGQPGPGDHSWGGWGGGSTLVSASAPPVSSPGQAPPIDEVVLVAGGGGGGGGGGTEHTGRTGGAGGVAVSTPTAAASVAGAHGSDGSGGNGSGGNPDGLGTGGAGGCSSQWCQGADGVGGFGGAGGTLTESDGDGTTRASTSLYPSAVIPSLTINDNGGYTQVAVQSPGSGGMSAPSMNSSGTVNLSCSGDAFYYWACGGGGGGGYGGGGGGDSKHTLGDGGLAGGGGGSYATKSTCGASGGPSEGDLSTSELAIFVAPTVTCEWQPDQAADDPAADDPAALAPVLAEIGRPADGAVGSRRVWRVGVRTEPGATVTLARLNGTEMTARLHRTGPRRWSGTVRPSDGLSPGENTLVVTAERGTDSWRASTHFIRTTTWAKLMTATLDTSGDATSVALARIGEDPVSTKVRLNGAPVPAGHLTRDGDLLTVRLSASSGLTHGRNRLLVTAYDRTGRYQRLTRRVWIPAASPIAGAGADQRVAAGGEPSLDGSTSLAGAGRRSAPGGLTYRWEVVRSPEGSSASPTGAGSATPRLRTDLPGRYLVRLTTTSPGGASSTDLVTVTADPVPNAEIHTLPSPGGTPGIEVASSWGCGSTTDTSCLFHSGASGEVQLLVLDRETLEPLFNDTYSPSDLEPMAVKVSDYSGDGYLVVITLDATAQVSDVDDFSTAVTQIGMPAYGSTVAEVPGPFSIIGVPGMVTGKAWHNFGRQLGTTDGVANPAGSLDGYLKDSAYIDSGGLTQGKRTFTFPDVVGFETRELVGTDVAVNWREYTPGDGTPGTTGTYTTTKVATFSTVGGTGGGLGVVTFDPYTLEVVSSHKWTPDTPAIDWVSVNDQLTGAVNAGDGVVITSLGQMSGYTSEPTAPVFADVLHRIEQLGGQPDIFARAVNDNQPYSFLGVGGQGLESSGEAISAYVNTAADPATLPAGTGNLTGELRRGSDGRFVPSQADPTGTYQTEMNPVLYQGPVEWPLTPAAGATEATGTELALAYLAQCVATPGPVVEGVALWDGQDCATDADNPPTSGTTASVGVVRQVALALRTDYYDDPALSLDDTIGDLQYDQVFPDPNPLITPSDFEAATQQLSAEFTAWNAVKTFFTSVIQAPIANDQAAVWQQMNNVANTVQQDYFAQQQSITVTNYSGWTWQMFGGYAAAAAAALTFFTATDGAGAVIAFAGLVSDAGNAFQTTVNGPQTSTFTDIESWLVLDEEVQNASAQVDNAVENSIRLAQAGMDTSLATMLSDWGRMGTVATNSASSSLWEPSDSAVEYLSNAFILSTRQQIWQGYAHQLWTAGYTPGQTANAFLCTPGGAHLFPFITDVDSGLPLGVGNGVQYWPVQSISTAAADGQRNYPTWKPYAMWQKASSSGAAPPSAAVDTIFQQPSTTKSSESAAGAYGPWFWASVFDLTTEVVSCNSSRKPETKEGTFY